LDDVEMRVEQKRRLASIALDPRDEVAPALLLLDDLRLDAYRAEVLGDALRRDGLVRVAGLSRALVDRRDPDQVAEELDAGRGFGLPVDGEMALVARHGREDSPLASPPQAYQKGSAADAFRPRRDFRAGASLGCVLLGSGQRVTRR